MHDLFVWFDNLPTYKVLALSNIGMVLLLGVSWLENQRLRKKIELILEIRYHKEEKKDA